MKLILKKISNMLLSVIGVFWVLGAALWFTIVQIYICRILALVDEEYLKIFKENDDSCELLIFKGKMEIGSIYFSKDHINFLKFRCGFMKGIIKLEVASVRYSNSYLSIIRNDNFQEIIKIKCLKEDFDKIEKVINS